jgi:hypothetical protein
MYALRESDSRKNTRNVTAQVDARATTVIDVYRPRRIPAVSMSQITREVLERGKNAGVLLVVLTCPKFTSVL